MRISLEEKKKELRVLDPVNTLVAFSRVIPRSRVKSSSESESESEWSDD